MSSATSRDLQAAQETDICTRGRGVFGADHPPLHSAEENTYSFRENECGSPRDSRAKTLVDDFWSNFPNRSYSTPGRAELQYYNASRSKSG